MIELLKKTFFSSIGIAYLTKEKIEDIGKKLIKDINLSEEEGKKFIDELVKKSESAKGSMEKFIRDTMDNTLKKLDIPNRNDIKELQNRIAILEKEKNSEHLE